MMLQGRPVPQGDSGTRGAAPAMGDGATGSHAERVADGIPALTGFAFQGDPIYSLSTAMMF